MPYLSLSVTNCKLNEKKIIKNTKTTFLARDMPALHRDKVQNEKNPLSQHPLPPAKHQPHPLTPSAQTMKQEETKKILKKDQISSRWYHITLAYIHRTQG